MRKKRIWNTVALATVSVCLVISLLILALYGFIVYRVLRDDDVANIDPEYAMLTARGEVVTERYEIAPCSNVRFFEDFSFKRTLFPNAVPKITIVNDTGYFVEITGNREFHEILQLQSEDGWLTVSCQDNQYVSVYEDDVDYDYDTGLYVDCTQLEFVVHAPISRLEVATNLYLDFEAAKAEDMHIAFSFDGVDGVIWGIDAQNLTLHCSGTSRLKLSGTVSDTADINLWHDSRVNAGDLSVGRYETAISRGIGGFSCLKGEKWYQLKCDLFFGPTNVIAFAVYAQLALWIGLEVKLICRRRKIREDTFDEKAT